MPSLQRFRDAQATSYTQARSELASGQKRTHWMWFIFPQLQGLGSSPTARLYALSSLHEASAYLADPVLGPRLHDCTALVTSIHGLSAAQIFGSPDDLKFHSCMTLFALAAPHDLIFSAALHHYFHGTHDPATLALLKA